MKKRSHYRLLGWLLLCPLSTVVAAERYPVQGQAYVQFEFGAREYSRGWQAGLQLLAPGSRLRVQKLGEEPGASAAESQEPTTASSPAYLHLEFLPGRELRLQLLGADFAGYRYGVLPTRAQAADQNGEEQVRQGSWLGRNWGKLALGAGAVALLAVAGGGGSSDAGEGTVTGATVSGGLLCSADGSVCVVPLPCGESGGNVAGCAN
ncbi:MAG: hypothetical protein EPN60_03635 [Nevskiaceae bacterium]|jgi:hypothetical protein|nr:MAG: hypothetical protein EPO48_10610 [Nevskiaceae bacterium]TAM32334.1 MAG: hypothetical protein EPN60_03635 [Nevskiaceae bacterium]